MQISKLYEIELDKDRNPVLYHTIELLKQAIIDWPTEIKTVEEFLFNVEKYLYCSAITIDVVNRAVSHVGSTNELWQLESLSSVRDLMNINEEETLEAILKGLILYLR